MAELRRTFSAGRMNKDIDERLLTPGEYRDALNVGVGNSESSDIGSVENLLGNERLGVGSITGEIVQGIGRDTAEFNFTNAITIGAARYDLQDKIYWFIAADEGSFILEFDQLAETNPINVVLADRNGLLNFSADNLITGINILGDHLYWTDGATEPKKLEINRFKEGSLGGETTMDGNNLPTHTQVYGRNFVIDDITVIKKSPLSAPNITVSETIRPGGGTFNVVSSFDFSTTEVGDTVNINLSTVGHAYIEGDIVRLTSNSDGVAKSISATVIRVVGVQLTLFINTLTDTNDSGLVTYNVDIVGNDVIFELRFPRFAYRWRYIDGEYSVYSPFSEVAFIPGPFDYNSEKGHNTGMVNNMRQLILDSFDTPPDDVVEIELLYKQSDSPVVYSVETDAASVSSVTVTNDQIHAILQDIQLLRPYDDVPRTAKAQDIVANRLVYGNYTHNYTVGVTPDFTVNLEARENDTIQSIKTNRNYQFGVVYQDRYGRQTPVLSNTSAAYKVTSETSDEQTQFALHLNNPAPHWATDYKFYIKETSTEYYNLALDRYYTGEDGFVWCSFPSSEFNKISVESYLILKKQHASSGAVKGPGSRFKVLDIRTEAPDFLLIHEEVEAKINYDASTTDGDTDNPTDTTDLPATDSRLFSWRVNPDSSYFSSIKTGNDIVFSDGVTEGRYTIDSVSDVANDPGNLLITLTEVPTDVSFITDGTDVLDNVTIEIITEVREQLPEFIGRFFVKLERNGIFDTNIIDTSTDTTNDEFGLIASSDIHDRVQPGHAGSDATGFFYDFREEARWKVNRGAKKEEFLRERGVGISVGSNRVDISYAGSEPRGFQNPLWSNEFGNYLGKTGTYIKFNNEDVPYKIMSVEHTAGPNLQSSTTSNAGTFGSQGNPTDGYYSINRPDSPSTSFKRWSITLDRPIESVPDLDVIVNQAVHGISPALDSKIEVFENLTETQRTKKGGTPYVADPAIFETEPTGDDALDIYYETQETFQISEHNTPQKIKWYNCFSFGNGVESDRIRDDFNGVRIDKGARVSATISEPFMEEHLPSGLIWSGIFNSITGINNTNQFILAEGIQKELQPLFGSIQRLHARDTNLIAFCEDKILRILADKDALFNADGSSNVTASNAVLGQTTPFTGEYGISKNPESFCTYGSRIYFTDKNRGVVLRLSQDGLTEVSKNGMEDFFRDRFRNATGNIVCSYDEYHDVMNVTIGQDTITYDENVGGWPSRKSFIPEFGITLNNRYYTWKNGNLWIHNSRNVPRNNFYGAQYASSIVFIFNDEPGTIKNFKTLSYEGTNPKFLASYDIDDNVVVSSTTTDGWFCPTLITDQEVGDARAFINKEGKWFTNLGVLGGPEAITAVEEALDFADINEDGSEESEEDLMDEVMEMVDEDFTDAEGLGPIEEMEELPDPDTGDPVEPAESTITIKLI